MESTEASDSRTSTVRRRGLFEFNRDVKVGDIISAAAIFVSGVGVVLSINTANNLTRSQQDMQRRTTLGKAVARLDRWQAVQASLQTELQPVIIQTTETLRETRSREAARDRFWREAIAAHAALERRAVGEQLDIGYEDVLIYMPQSRGIYLGTYHQLQSLSDQTIQTITAEAQRVIFSWPEDRFSDTAGLGNALRQVVSRAFVAAAARSEQLTRSPRQQFCEQIAPEDEQAQNACSSKPRTQ